MKVLEQIEKQNQDERDAELRQQTYNLIDNKKMVLFQKDDSADAIKHALYNKNGFEDKPVQLNADKTISKQALIQKTVALEKQSQTQAVSDQKVTQVAEVQKTVEQQAKGEVQQEV